MPTTTTFSPPPHPLAIRLGDYAHLAVEGARAAEFLQGQLTCNVPDAGATRVLPGAYCTPKGRVVASFLLWQPEPERVLLRLRADIAEPTAALLSKYGVFSRVRIGAPVPPLACFGLLGMAVRERLADVFREWPAALNAATPAGAGCLIRRDESGALHELWVEAQAADAWWERLCARLDQGEASRWRHALVCRAEAEIQAATRDEFLPQMLGYDTSGAVSFRKGCYTGQEVVARTHYRGSVKRHLHALVAAGSACPAVGTGVVCGERSVGTVVECGTDPETHCAVLAVIADEALAAGAPALQTTDGTTLRALV